MSYTGKTPLVACSHITRRRIFIVAFGMLGISASALNFILAARYTAPLDHDLDRRHMELPNT